MKYPFPSLSSPFSLLHLPYSLILQTHSSLPSTKKPKDLPGLRLLLLQVLSYLLVLPLFPLSYNSNFPTLHCVLFWGLASLLLWVDLYYIVVFFLCVCDCWS